MINNSVIKELLKNNKTAEQTMKILEKLVEYFRFIFDPKRNESEKEIVFLEAKQNLQNLNKIAESISLDPVFIDDGNLNEDMKNYFIENLN